MEFTFWPAASERELDGKETMEFTRRDLGKIAIASVPLSRAFAAKMIDSKFGGVQIGAISYSFNRLASPDPGAIVKAYVEIGLGECELMSNHCEALAGAPAMPRSEEDTSEIQSPC